MEKALSYHLEMVFFLKFRCSSVSGSLRNHRVLFKPSEPLLSVLQYFFCSHHAQPICTHLQPSTNAVLHSTVLSTSGGIILRCSILVILTVIYVFFISPKEHPAIKQYNYSRLTYTKKRLKKLYTKAKIIFNIFFSSVAISCQNH